MQQAKWELTSRIRDESNVPNAFHFSGDHRSSRGSGPAVPDEVLATTGLGGSARQMSASVFHPSSGRPDCVAGHVRLELRNVAINYPLVRAHRFAGIQPNSGRRDYSRLSCAAGEMPLGPRAAGIFSKRCAPKWPSSGIVRRELAAVSADPKMLRRRPNQQYHCALCAGLWAQRERVW